MLRIQYIFVGKLKTAFWRSAAEHYDKRIKHWYRCRETVIRDAVGKDPLEKISREGRAILDKTTPGDFVICLDEHGQSMTSPGLAKKLQIWFEDPVRTPCFVVGGAYGLDQQVLNRANFQLSLGPMTLPHELARVTLLEQLYRAGAILKKSPYHHT